MSIALLGDLHGRFVLMKYLVDEILEARPDVTAIVQVGDFGYYPETVDLLKQFDWPVPIYWIDGNHEDFNLFLHHAEVTEVNRNIFYVPRGTILNLEGYRMLCMGGAASINYKISLRNGWHWDTQENITPQDIEKVKDITAADVDLLITHVPPQSVIAKNFNPMDMLQFEVSIDWKDPNADVIEDLWKQLDYIPMYCGHMHKTVQDRTCRIIDINEWLILPPKEV